MNRNDLRHVWTFLLRVVANVKFSYVLEKIKPLEKEQSKLQTNLKMATDQIGQLSSGLDEVDQQVITMTTSFFGYARLQ